MNPIKFNNYLEKIAKGDINELAHIYNEYYSKMVMTAANKVKNIEDAQDIASSLLEYILQNACTIGYIKSPTAWIVTSIRNRAINFIKKDSRTVAYAECSEDSLTSNIDNDKKLIIIESIDSLSEMEKEILDLHFNYGYKYKEISEQLGRTIGTIKSDISIIKKKLAHLLE